MTVHRFVCAVLWTAEERPGTHEVARTVTLDIPEDFLSVMEPETTMSVMVHYMDGSALRDGHYTWRLDSSEEIPTLEDLT